MGESHSFSVYIRNKTKFNLIADLFSQTTSWLLTLRLKSIRFVISATQTLLRVPLTLIINKIQITATSGLRGKIPVTLKIKRIVFTAITSLLEKWTQTLSIKKIAIEATISELASIKNIELGVNTVVITADTIVAVFTLLNAYSGSTLSEMDSTTLTDLAYTIVP